MNERNIMAAIIAAGQQSNKFAKRIFQFNNREDMETAKSEARKALMIADAIIAISQEAESEVRSAARPRPPVTQPSPATRL